MLTADSTYVGSSGFDVLVGQNGNDTFVGGSGTETFIPAGGSNTITGGAGVDTVQFNGPSTNYVITQNSNGSVSVTNGTVTDHISNVGYLQFTDKTIVVDQPTITGAVAGQTTISEAPISPFTGATISDANTQATETLTITVGGVGGTLSGAGLTGGAAGVYALTGSAATLTSELAALSFTPKAGAPNSSSTSSFTLSDHSSAYTTPTINSTTTVVDHDPAVAPTIANTAAGQTTASEAPVMLFAGVTISDANAQAAETLTITVGGTGGTLSGGGLTGGASGVYTLSGSAATVTGELDALTFTPKAGAPNTSSTSSFTLSDQSSAYPTPTINNTTTVVDHDGAGATLVNPNGNQETFVAPLANTTVQGGGYDILNMSQNPIATASSAYTETSNHNGTFNLATTGSTDVVSGVMQVQFSDKTVTVATNGSENEFVALLYQGALGRPPDATGLAGWEQIGAALPSVTTQSLGLAYALSDTSGGYNGSLSIAAGFTQSAEFIAKYGTLTPTQFVTQLYANILDRAPDPAGLAGWLAQLSAGASEAHVLVGFADSAEAINNATLGYTGQSGAHASWLFLT